MFTVFTLLQFSEKLFSHSEAFRTVFAVCFQVASRVLGIPSSKIHISETSTNTVPNTSATAASASSDLNGAALKNACEILLKRLEPFKAKNPNGTWEDWVNRAKFVIVLFGGGGLFPLNIHLLTVLGVFVSVYQVKAAYFDRVSLSANGFYKWVHQMNHWLTSYYNKMKGFTVSRFLIRTPDIGYDFETNSGRAFSYFSYGVACSEVEIDCLTGSHKVCTKYSYIYLSSNSWIKCLKRFKELWLILSPLSIWLRCLTPHFFSLFQFFNFTGKFWLEIFSWRICLTELEYHHSDGCWQQSQPSYRYRAGEIFKYYSYIKTTDGSMNQ